MKTFPSPQSPPTRGGEVLREIKILTSKFFSGIKCRCKDRFEKGGQCLGERGCEMV
jgi:hypothetical protein